MNEKSRILILIGIMSAIAVGGVSITTYTLYEAAFSQEQERLRETVQSRARIIESIANFDKKIHASYGEPKHRLNAFEATLKQIRVAHKQFKGFGETGEFTLAQQESDKIVFLLRHRHDNREQLASIDLNSNFAEPMRRALKGLSGTIIGLDYRGEMVLAAYEPLTVYGLGIVAKIDLSEVRKPFIWATAFSIVFVFIFIGLGTFLFLRIGNPIIAKLEREVEEHTKARKELGISESRFRRIFESNMVGVMFWDADGNIREANRSFLDIVGYTQDDLQKGVSWKSLTPAEYRKTDETFIKQLAEEGHITPFEKEYFHKDGRRVPIIIGAATMLDARDKGVAFILDRTALKKAEEAKKASEASLHLMVSEVRDYAILMLDKDGRVASWNIGAQSIKGYEGHEIIGQHFSKFYRPEDIADGRPANALDIATRVGRYEEESVRIRKDGSTFMANVVITALKDENGKLLGFSKFTRDITERKRGEDRIRNSLQEKEVLLREIHHRVKNNLQIVGSLLSLQSQSIADQQAVTVLRESRDRINTMAMIHEKLYGTQNLRRIDFASYVEAFSKGLLNAAGSLASRITLKNEIGGIEFDVQKAIPLGMIINELLSNSLKHAFPDNRKGTIHIALYDRAKELSLEFKDDGVGFPDDWELSKTESLGMRLVQMFTEQLDGKVEHIRGGGARFRITFSINLEE